MQDQHSKTESSVTRRTALGGVSVGAAAVTLTACSGNSNNSTDSNNSLTDDKGPAQPTDVAAATDVPVGGALKATAKGVTVLVTQPTEGTFKAFSSVCTHQGCQINVLNKDLNCPCHASVFSIKYGSVQGGPADTPLPEYKVEVKDGRVIVSS